MHSYVADPAYPTLLAADSPSLLSMLLHGAHGALVAICTIGTPVWVELVNPAEISGIHRP